ITAFFAIGAYSTVALHKLVPWLPLPAMIVIGGVMAALVGLGTGYLTLRLRGVFFSIATLALAVVVQTLITNWDFVGGARGAYVLRPKMAPLIGGEYMQYLFLLMLGLGVIVQAEHEQEQVRSEEHTSELQSPCNLVCRLLLEKKN